MKENRMRPGLKKPNQLVFIPTDLEYSWIYDKMILL